jgi:predicted metal-binding membrane protein
VSTVVSRTSSSAPRGGPPGIRGLRAGQLTVLAVLLGLAAAAWLVSDLRMAGMDAGPGTDPGAFGFYISTWVVMMAAMMFPSIGPMVLTYSRLRAGRPGHGDRVQTSATAVFVAGYLVVWAASGLIAYAVLKAGRALDGGALGWHEAGRWVAAGVLAAAAAYEVTPWKNACLTRCRSPLGFLVGNWRDGVGGAWRMGVEHGGWCLGCCWLLMVGLFALGVMSITWMILITVLIGAEKLLPRPLLGTGVVAAALAALAIGIAAAPAKVPGLTIPGSPAAMHAMAAMRGSMHSMGAAMSPAHSMSAMHPAMSPAHSAMSTTHPTMSSANR